VLYILSLSVIVSSVLPGDYTFGTVYADDIPFNYGDLIANNQGVKLRAEVNTFTGDYDAEGAPLWAVMEFSLNPERINVTIVIEVHYIEDGDELVPVYSFLYRGKFYYDNPENTTIYFPLPSGMITDLAVKVNDDLVEHPELISNNIRLFLPEEDSMISVAFNSYGKTSYTHEVPKNGFVKHFQFRALLRKVGSDDVSLDESLTPDSVDTSNSVRFDWDNKNAIMRKDIKIDLLQRTSDVSSGFLGNFISGLIFMGIPITAFYFEGFNRLKHEKKAENYIMLFMPYVILGMVLWTLVLWIEAYLALLISLLGFTAGHLMINQKILKFKKGHSEFFLIPLLFIVFLIGYVIDNKAIGTLLISFSTLSLMLLLAWFVRRYPRPPRAKGNRKFPQLTVKKENNVVNAKTEKPSVKSESTQSKTNKKFCPHCGSSVENDFGFCPRCGRDISVLERCSNCGVLRKMSTDAMFCPNCGNQEMENMEVNGLKKRFSFNRNSDTELEKTS
jgi:RNA polymerase subunit RPABC4/transcription elongation factor Spt4